MGVVVDFPRFQAFDPDTTSAMSRAVDEVWSTLRESGHVWTRDMRMTIARSVLQLAAAGERDPVRLRDGALADFFTPQSA
jgi:hypothetical protein